METNEQHQPAPTIAGADLETSPTIGAISEALAKAQEEIGNAIAGRENTHFKSSYSDLGDIVNACRLPLAKNKISRWQPVVIKNGEVGVRTQLTHSTGEFLAFTLWCKPSQPGPQALGSVITYLRRYGLAAAVGVGQEDDDGEAGVGRGQPREQERQPQQQKREAKSAEKPAETKPAPAASASSVDEEHKQMLADIRDAVGKKLGWETAAAVRWMEGLFGVKSTHKMSKEQATVCLSLLLAAVESDEKYQDALVKARALKPSLFKPSEEPQPEAAA